MLPDWLTQNETYVPQADHSLWLRRNMLHLMRLLRRAAAQHGTDGRNPASAAPKLLMTLLYILLLSVSSGAEYLWAAAAGVLIVLALLPGRMLRHTLQPVFPVAIFTLILLIPCAILTGIAPCIRMLAKVCLSLTAISILAHTTSWNRLTGGLNQLHLPDTFIFLLDSTLRFLALAGQAAAELNEAMAVRSIGRNEKKYTTLGGILGTVWLRTNELAQQTSEAMQCRGWDGSYSAAQNSGTKLGNFRCVLMAAAMIAAFLLLEVLTP